MFFCINTYCTRISYKLKEEKNHRGRLIYYNVQAFRSLSTHLFWIMHPITLSCWVRYPKEISKYIPNVCRNGVNPLSNLAFEEAANISAKEHSMLPIDSWSRGSWLGLVQSSMENLRYCKKKKKKSSLYINMAA